MNPNGQYPQNPQGQGSFPSGQPSGSQNTNSGPSFQQQYSLPNQYAPQGQGNPGVQGNTPLGARPGAVSQNFIHTESSTAWKITAIVAIISAVILAGLAVWSVLTYASQRDTIQERVDSEVAIAVKEQADKDAARFEEEANRDYTIFTGPEDLGSVSFNYPKTWSVYVATGENSNNSLSRNSVYEAYLNPGQVPALSTKSQYATRVIIDAEDYDKKVESYAELVEEGSLKSSVLKVNNGAVSATRFDGEFSEDLRGSIVIFKIRDKTVTIGSDAAAFMPVYNELIKTINFNE